MPLSQGTRTSAFVEAVDLFPTLLALNGIEHRVWDLKQYVHVHVYTSSPS